MITTSGCLSFTSASASLPRTALPTTVTRLPLGLKTFSTIWQFIGDDSAIKTRTFPLHGCAFRIAAPNTSLWSLEGCRDSNRVLGLTQLESDVSAVYQVSAADGNICLLPMRHSFLQ